MPPLITTAGVAPKSIFTADLYGDCQRDESEKSDPVFGCDQISRGFIRRNIHSISQGAEVLISSGNAQYAKRILSENLLPLKEFAAENDVLNLFSRLDSASRNVVQLSQPALRLIPKKPSSPIDLLASTLNRDLGLSFDLCEIPQSQRAALSFKIATLMLEVSVKPSGLWSGQIASRRSQPAPIAEALATPDYAPAIWKTDKLPGDTPPDFIMRHYGAWLRVDGAGLTRPDVKRLDPTLYMALANWLRANELPDDCPLPTKSQVVDSLLAQSENRAPRSTHELWRIQSAKRRRDSSER